MQRCAWIGCKIAPYRVDPKSGSPFCQWCTLYGAYMSTCTNEACKAQVVCWKDVQGKEAGPIMCEPCNLAVTCSKEGCDRLNDTVYICDVCNRGYVCANCLDRRLPKEAEYVCEVCTSAMQQVFVLTREPKDTDEWLEQMAAAVRDAQAIRRKKKRRV